MVAVPRPGDKRVFIHTLGCPKNEVDSEVMAGLLRKEGMRVVPDIEEADLILVNTCTFLDEAKEESIEAIIEAGRLKGKRKLLVTGCLVERYQAELRQELPEIDGLVGVRSLDTVGGVARRLMQGSPVCDQGRMREAAATDTIGEGRFPLGTAHTAYIKIAEGCGRPCAFCSIPSFRGPLTSRSPDSLEREARSLALRGAKEIVVVGQETTAYGDDLEKGSSLPRLLDRFNSIDGLRWIRVLYAYPSAISGDLIRRLGDRKVCRYIDMPVQHASTRVLRRMRRGVSGRAVRETIERIRSWVPEITLRSTVMVGFPGERETDFRELVRFVEETQFDHLGVFRFSPQEDTQAVDLPDPVPVEIAREREQELLDIQEQITTKRNDRRLGSVVEVLVDRCSNGETWCRTEGDAPDVDGAVLIPGACGKPGDFLEVEITDAHGSTLIGRTANFP